MNESSSKPQIINPVERCSSVLQKYCSISVLSQSAIREISTYVLDLYKVGQLNEVDMSAVELFLQNQSENIKKSREFQYEIVEICLSFYAAKDMPKKIYKYGQV